MGLRTWVLAPYMHSILASRDQLKVTDSPLGGARGMF